MALPNTAVGDNPQQPFAVAENYVPDQLIAGEFPLVTMQVVTITGGALLKRGTVLGQVLLGVASVAAASANTGNGVISAVSLGSRAKAGVYEVIWGSPSGDEFYVIDPQGLTLEPGVKTGSYGGTPAGVVGAVPLDPEINFTWTPGTTRMVAGDRIAITVAAGSGSFKQAVATNTDGSNVCVAVLADQADASAADVTGAVYLTGMFNSNALILDPSISLATATAQLRPQSIFTRTAVSAADPT